MLDDILGGRKALLVASTGGHLAQLHRLTMTSAVAPDSLWVTFETPQSTSRLHGQRTLYLDYIPPRGLREVVRGFRRLAPVVASEQFDVVVSTGAGIALASHLPATARREHPVYIESVSRVQGPSATGRILERVPGIRRYSQHAWGHTRRGWQTSFSVLDTFAPLATAETTRHPAKVFVSLGTIAPYEFAELVRAVDRTLPRDAEIIWQLGVTKETPSRGRVHTQMSSPEFDAATAWADVVITHAGVGTLIGLIESGSNVIAVPRRRMRNEHVDDHQTQIAHEFTKRGLIRSCEVEDLSAMLTTTPTL